MKWICEIKQMTLLKNADKTLRIFKVPLCAYDFLDDFFFMYLFSSKAFFFMPTHTGIEYLYLGSIAGQIGVKE